MPRLFSILFVLTIVMACVHVESYAQAHTEKRSLFFIALNDAGKHGTFVGCGDSVVPVDLFLSTSSDKQVLRAVLDSLLDIKTRTYGPGLYNPLYQSHLRLKRAVIRENRAFVDLAGELKTGGECDTPRVEAQLRKTIMQFPQIVAVSITLNGLPIEHALDYSGKP